MREVDPSNTFRGLPLTAEQDAEIRHHVKKKRQRGEPLDPSELEAMLKDMLEPPSNFDDGIDVIAGSTKLDAERAAAAIDEAMEPIEASEERTAAMELEAMKRPPR